MDIEEEIDLRAYVVILLKHKFWILGVTVAAVVLGALFSVLLPSSYQAAVSAFISDPQSVALPLVGPADTRTAKRAYAVYRALALGDDVLSSLVGIFGTELASEEDPVSAMRDLLEVTIDEDAGTIELVVEHSDRELVLRIANEWAVLFVEKANSLYSVDLAFYEAQLAEASTALAKAEQALSDFQTENESLILTTLLESERLTLDAYWGASRSLWLSIQDAKSLQGQLRSDGAAANVSFANHLASLLVQVSALSSNDMEPGLQIQMLEQANLGDGQTVDEFIAFLESLIEAMETKQRAVEQQAESLEPEILRLQKEIADLESKREVLEREKELALEAFVALSRKVTETRLAATSAADHVSLIRSARKAKAVGLRKLYVAAVAAIVGLGGSVLGALAAEYWRQGKPESQMEG